MNKIPYISPAATVDVAIFTIENNVFKVLLTKRENAPFKGEWALPGVFLLKNEVTAAGAKRALAVKSKAKLKNAYIEQLYTFDSATRDPRGHTLTVAYFALVPQQNIVFLNKDRAQSTLVPVKKLPKLAFDHKDIITYALQRVRYKLEYTNAVFALLPKEFTFNQLQSAYETVLGRGLDKRNFRKKFLSLKLIKPVKKKLTGARQRPAELFTFIRRKPEELKRFF